MAMNKKHIRQRGGVSFQDPLDQESAQRALRKANIFYENRLAGILEETDQGYRFVYTLDYLKIGRPISLSLPLQEEVFESGTLFPFFAGMIPEGWYRDIVCATKKIDPADEFGILLVTGASTIGAVTVKESGLL